MIVNTMKGRRVKGQTRAQLRVLRNILWQDYAEKGREETRK